jgi:hypothetical protein
MTYPDLPRLPGGGRYLMLAGLFVLREIMSETLNGAGKELWTWAQGKLVSHRQAPDHS